MQFTPIDPPRAFTVGKDSAVILRDCGRLELSSDEQITLVSPFGSECDIARKTWGYYATPSLNYRLVNHGLRAALVVNKSKRLYLLLVESGKETEFSNYLQVEEQTLLTWLDDDHSVERLIAHLTAVN